MNQPASRPPSASPACGTVSGSIWDPLRSLRRWKRVMAEWRDELRRSRRFSLEITQRLDHVRNLPLNAIPDALHRLTQEIIHRPDPQGLPKGAPNVSRLLRDRAFEAQTLIGQASQSKATAAELLRLTRWMAAADARDSTAFVLYGLCFRWINRDILGSMQEAIGPNVVMHLSCWSRLPRAIASTQSFAAANRGLTHVIVVGSGRSDGLYDWNAEAGILTVPSPDTYEHLAGKVAAAYFFLGMLAAVRAVLKVDDDHRLGNPAVLKRVLGAVGSAAAPTQFGHFYYSPYYGGHTRVWHIGKCGSAPINDRPYTHLGALHWCTGEKGYVLNRAALQRLVWAYVYFQDLIETAVYEDVMVSELLVRLGGRLRRLYLEDFLSTTVEY